MNLPNQLTVSRFAITAAFLVAVFARFPGSDSIALVLFLIASATDWLDGKLARSRNQITNFGILMDPLADKILTCSAFIAFVERGWIAGWMVVVIVARELAITGLRLLAASKNLVLAAERFGKHKTASQIVAITAILMVAAYPEWGSWGHSILGGKYEGRAWIEWFSIVAKWVAVGLTLYSGLVYLWRNRELYLAEL